MVIHDIYVCDPSQFIIIVADEGIFKLDEEVFSKAMDSLGNLAVTDPDLTITIHRSPSQDECFQDVTDLEWMGDLPFEGGYGIQPQGKSKRTISAEQAAAIIDAFHGP